MRADTATTPNLRIAPTWDITTDDSAEPVDVRQLDAALAELLRALGDRPPGAAGHDCERERETP